MPVQKIFLPKGIFSSKQSDNWGLDRIDQIDLPLDGQYRYQFTGKNVDIAIVDSGITETFDINGRVFLQSDFRTYLNTNHKNYIPNTSIEFSKDFIGHGTHIATVIGGKKYGVAKETNLHSFKIFHKNFDIDLTSVTQVYNDLLAWHNGKTTPTVVLVNHPPIKGNPTSQFLENIFISLNATNRCIILTPAGNKNDDASLYFPANSLNTITVGSTNITDEFSVKNPLISPVGNLSSNFGSVIDILAPGEDILALIFDDILFQNTGTAVAAAFVAGLAALYIESGGTPTTSSFRNWIIEHSTKNRIRNLNLVTPNRLLFSPLQDFTQVITLDTDVFYVNEGSSISLDIRGSFRVATSRTYSLEFQTNDPLPPNLVLASNGNISGTLAKVSSNSPNYVSIVSASSDVITLLPFNAIGFDEYAILLSASAQGFDISKNIIIRVIDFNNSPVWLNSSKSLNTYISSINHNDTINFDFKTLVFDTDNDTLIFSLLNGTLPKGLTLSSNGILKGIVSAFPVSSSSIPFVSAGVQTFTEEFTIRVTDGFYFTDQFFSATVTRDSSTNTPPSFVSPVYPNKLLSIEKGGAVEFKLQATDAENDKLVFNIIVSASAYTIVSANPSSITITVSSFGSSNSLVISAASFSNIFLGLPSGLSVDSNGNIQGLIPLDVSSGQYIFFAEVFDGYDTDYNLFMIEVNDIGSIFNSTFDLSWDTNSNLGQITETYPSILKIKAIHTSNAALEYELSPGSFLPPGLVLNQEKGYITGTLEYIPSDSTFSFFVKAKLKNNPSVFIEKQFIVSAVDVVTSSITEFSLYFPSLGNNLEDVFFTAIVSSSPTHLSQQFRYREGTDSNFPIKMKKEVLITRGTKLTNDNVVLSALGFDVNTILQGKKSVWREIDLFLGETEKAVARNEKGEIVYQVIYIKLEDGRKAASETPSIITTISGFNIVVPTSLEIMRQDLIDEIGLENEVLPQWMISGQISANDTPLGYVPALVLMYLNPDVDSDLVLQEIKTVRKTILPVGTAIKAKGLIYRKFNTMNNPEEHLIYFPINK